MHRDVHRAPAALTLSSCAFFCCAISPSQIRAVYGAPTCIQRLSAVRRWRCPQLVTLRRSQSKYYTEQVLLEVGKRLASNNDRSESIRASQIILRSSLTSPTLYDADTLVRSSWRHVTASPFLPPPLCVVRLWGACNTAPLRLEVREVVGGVSRLRVVWRRDTTTGARGGDSPAALPV
jgi:hypothetical protein